MADLQDGKTAMLRKLFPDVVQHIEQQAIKELAVKALAAVAATKGDQS